MKILDNLFIFFDNYSKLFTIIVLFILSITLFIFGISLKKNEDINKILLDTYLQRIEILNDRLNVETIKIELYKNTLNSQNELEQDKINFRFKKLKSEMLIDSVKYKNSIQNSINKSRKLNDIINNEIEYLCENKDESSVNKICKNLITNLRLVQSELFSVLEQTENNNPIRINESGSEGTSTDNAWPSPVEFSSTIGISPTDFANSIISNNQFWVFPTSLGTIVLLLAISIIYSSSTANKNKNNEFTNT